MVALCYNTAQMPSRCWPR